MHENDAHVTLTLLKLMSKKRTYNSFSHFDFFERFAKPTKNWDIQFNSR